MERSISLALPYKGLNSSLPPIQLDDAEMADCLNFWVSKLGHFECRPGLTKMTTTSNTGSAIKGGYYSPTKGELLVASGTKLYKYSSNGVSVIGTLSGANARVQMLDFAGDVYVASGGILQVYNGTTLSNVTNSGTNDPPQQARWMYVRRDRLFVADDTDSSLYYSDSYDGGDWGGGEGAGGGIIHIRKNDGAIISGLALIDADLAIFKANLSNINNPVPCSMSILTGPTPTDFIVSNVREGTSVVEPHTIQPVIDDTLFCGNGGIFTLAQIRNYGNPRSFPLSLKIMPHYGYATPYSAYYSSGNGYYVVATNNGVFALHTGMKAWFKWIFQGITPTYVFADSNDRLVFGSDDGHLYYLDDSGNNFNDDSSVPSWHFISRAYHLKTPAIEKWFHRLYMTIQPLSGSGVVGVNYKRNVGEADLGSRAVSVTTADVAGWDGGFCWDDSEVGWDESTIVQRGHIVQLRGKNIQFQFVPTLPVRLFGWTMTYSPFRRASISWK